MTAQPGSAGAGDVPAGSRHHVAAAWIRPLFLLSAAYDAILGLMFLTAPTLVFERFDVTPPNHVGYVQFPAALLLIFALMFLEIARDPLANRRLMILGLLLKVAYCGLTFGHWLSTDVPWIWKPFAWIDLVMGILFALAFVSTRPSSG